jgi:DNA repair protein RadC
MAISDWPEDERPREKLLKRGADALSDGELLAIFLRVGVAGRSAVDLARDLLTQHQSLAGLFSASERELVASKGIGKAKAAQLKAAFELAKRALNERIPTGKALSSPDAVRNTLQDWMRLHLAGRQREVFVVAYLDSQNRLIQIEQMFEGTLTQTSVYPREIVRHALRHNARSVIFAHNHPSGVAEPSQADQVLTETLKRALRLVDIEVLDHFVIGHGAALSFAERGLL